MNNSSLSQFFNVFWRGIKNLFSPTVWVRVEEPLRIRLVILILFLGITGFLSWGLGVYQFLGWFLGVFLGWWFLDVDQIVDVLWIKSESPLAVDSKQAINEKNWQKLFVLIFDTRLERKELVLHSIVFQGLLFVLALYIASSGSLFGKGIVLGLLFRTIYEQIKIYLKEGTLGIWLWQIKDTIPTNIQGLYLVGSMIVFVWLTLFAL